MREPMHPIYTAVPMRSVRAYAKREPVTLEAVLCAAIVDPENAEDAFEEYGVKDTPHSLRDFCEWRGASGVDLALQIASKWTMQREESCIVIRQIIGWDYRVGVWCVCQVARESLRYVPADEERCRIAIETAERWVAGDATIDEVRAAYVASNTAYATYSVSDAAVSARSATYAAYVAASSADATYAAYAASAAAYAAASNAADDAVIYIAADATYAAASAVAASAKREQTWAQSRDEELVRLREVIANACLTFPR